MQIRRNFTGAATLLLLLTPAPRAAAADGPTGEQIYRQRCANCHGPAGEGTKEFAPRPLVGDRSAPQLARLIARTMPKDDPGSCVGVDADKVAAYVHDAFYSEEARLRASPPRVELARLTVAQHQGAVADLIAGLRAPGRWDERRGLRGEYFASRRLRDDQRVLDRLDAEVRFDFKGDSPVKDKIKPEEFAIRWSGSLLAPETGEYELILKTENGARLWLNDGSRPLIDGWVRSGVAPEQRGTVRLLGGRAYPLRLEMFKSKEAKEKTASITLEWKPPHGVAGPIPTRLLTPNRFPETLVLETAFPPDDRSLGWERATAVSRAWEQAAADAALETASYVSAHLSELSGVRDDAADRGPRLKAFAGRLAERAFRRPLSDEEKRRFVERPFEAASGPGEAVKRVVLLVLLSPRFLYREAGGGPQPYDVASRLAFALWDAPPDQELLDAAAAGRLATREQVMAQAERLLNDPRARAKLRQFFFRWLRVDQAPDLAKDKARFPGFDPAVAADLRMSLDLFLEDVVWGPEPDFRRLLLAEEVYLNGRLAGLYGVDLPAEAPFQKVKLDDGRRAGVLTHAYLLSAFAYTGASSPIHRGVFLARGVLGVKLQPPQDAFTPLAEDLHPNLTTRQRVALQTKPPSCQACHGVINPLGFALERFDAVGRYRDRDNGKPVDASGGYEARDGKDVKFDGARELAAFLAGSVEVQNAFITQLFHHLAQQPLHAYGPGQPAGLQSAFAERGFDIRRLAVEAAVLYAVTGREPKPAFR
jgi:mono/diheme cytochrome c family protein